MYINYSFISIKDEIEINYKKKKKNKKQMDD